jgi:hypothetical protein
MCNKTKLHSERVCFHCQNDRHLLFFRFIEKSIVYYFSKCTKCNYSYRANMSTDKWRQAIEEHMQLQQLTKHHRLPKSSNGSDKQDNISLVPLKKHQAYHCLFGTKTPQEIARCLTELWIDPSWELLAVKKT